MGDFVTKLLRRRGCQWEVFDVRTAAEVMAAVVTPLVGPRIAGEYIEEGNWRCYFRESTGPAASQIFTAAVMREQVDPI